MNITVMLGGRSAERDVSLSSGAGVVNALRALGHRVTELDPQTTDWILPEGTDVVCLAPLHGTYGEDGTVQERLELLGVPYTGCDARASRIAFDKVQTKQCCILNGIPTARYLVVNSENDDWPAGWEPPVVVKPVCQGSSVGVCFVERRPQWRDALREAFRHDARVLVEEKIEGRETTVGILEGKPLPVVEVRPKSGAYDYRNKYTPGCTDYFCPAPLERQVTRRVQEVAVAIFEAIGCRDYARVDVMIGPSGEPMVLEVNTLPGMTPTSLMPKAAAAAGLDYPRLCQYLIELALRRKPRRAAALASGEAGIAAANIALH